jgi:hypothetical protein
VTQWGSEGSGDGQFRWLEGIAVDGSGDVYVADRANDRVQKFAADGSFLTKWGSYGSEDGQFDWPRGIAVDGSGNVYVADSGNNRIQKFAPDYPTPDPVHGLALNGSFEETPDLVHWTHTYTYTYGGELLVMVTDTHAYTGTYAALLGEPTEATPKERGMAWLRQTMYIRPEWERPVLTFHYRMFVNHTIDWSDFRVWLTRSNGALLDEIKRDGYDSLYLPPPGHDMGWRTASYDLSGFKGQTVRVVFENRNLHRGSRGIWTYVDDVRVVGWPYSVYLPMVMNGYSTYDSVVGGLGVESMVRPPRP